MNPVAFSLFGLEIRWYSIILLIAFCVAYLLISKEASKFKVRKDFIFNLLFWVLIFGVIGARIYYVIFEFDSFRSNQLEILKIWNGGLAIHGGILAGLVVIFAYTKKYKVRTIRYLDFIVVGLVLAQAIGRWGNFFNQEAHGLATSLEHLEQLHIPGFIINGMKIGDVYYCPAFLYESILCFLTFVLLIIIRRGRYVKVGSITGLYLICYGILRFFIEKGRTDSLMIGGIKVALIISALMITIGLIILIINKKKGKFEDLYNDKNNIEDIQY